MAGLSGRFPFKSISSQSSATATATTTTSSSSSATPFRTSIFPLPLPSSKSNAFRFRLHNSNSLRLVSSPIRTSVFARYGGAPRSSGPAGSKRSEDSLALDVSSIRSNNVRLIDEQQNMVGIVPKSQAIQMAEDAELDLVVLSPDADPPVVRIMDYSKYRYDLQKKKREQQKKSAATRMDLKELKMGYKIDQHDYSVRLRAAKKFLQDGDKVKVIVNLKGRENEFRKIAIELVKRFQEELGELATEEAKNFRDRNVFIVLAPNKAVLQKSQEPPKKKDKPAAVNEVSARVEVSEASSLSQK
ncbi:translation initiation factor IF3-4, chloroplastic-like [Cucurbita moschata]|uniref:Translation initiation factor IF-3 n=1 Tax=Cucurbita moschata TaxID=3662 RepID=A0A6J1G3Y5_CUCMO|nr:translation initiation factor IF3-4, chloroplastic-like [Cucurbita moschata]